MAALATITALYGMLPKKAKKALRTRLVGEIMGTGNGDGLIDGVLKNASREINGPSEEDKKRYEADVKERLKPYKKTFLQDALYGGASAGADVFKGVQDYRAVKDSLLGDALLAMSHIADSPGYVNPLTAAVAPMAAAQKVKSAGNQILGDTAHKAIHDIADTLREGAERRLSTELLIRENPNAGFYDYNRHRSNVYNNQRGRNY